MAWCSCSGWTGRPVDPGRRCGVLALPRVDELGRLVGQLAGRVLGLRRDRSVVAPVGRERDGQGERAVRVDRDGLPVDLALDAVEGDRTPGRVLVGHGPVE